MNQTKNNKKNTQNPPPRPTVKKTKNVPARQRRMLSYRAENLAIAPVATNRSMRSQRMQSVYCQSERISTVANPANIDFHVLQTVAINPGLAASFPWLSGHASLFEKYEIRGLQIRFKNLLSTTTNGNIILSFSYDTLDADPTTALIATQKAAYVDGAVWRETVLNIPIRRKELFVRVGDVPPNSDLKTYDYGKLWVCCEGLDVRSNIGYIEVFYDIVLRDKSEQLIPYSAIYTVGGVNALYSEAPIISAANTSETLKNVSFTYTPADSAAMTRGPGTFPLTFPVKGSVLVTLSFIAETSTVPAQQIAKPPNQLSLASVPGLTSVPINLSYVGELASAFTYYGTCTFAVNVAAPFSSNFTLEYSYTPTFGTDENYELNSLTISALYSAPPV